MSEQFTIVGEEYVGYIQGNAYIISDEKYKINWVKSIKFMVINNVC